MRKFILASLFFVASFVFAGPANAWNCPNGQHWVQTPGQTNVEVGSCVPDNPTPPPSSGSTNSNSNSNTNNNSNSSSSTSNSSANQSQDQSQSQDQKQSQTATGGNATANGGSATATNGGQSNSQTSTYVSNQVRQAPPAFAPEAIPTSPCRIAGSIGASSPVGGISLGGSKIDNECDKRQTAQALANIGATQAACKVLLNTKAAKEAHVTECDTPVKELKSSSRVSGRLHQH
ncbi:MAG: hypothetical protein LAN36_11530 [Acidobacteriia bacterium]|nr:hypothetical protein [Terriglobia bacterium]